MKKTALLFCVLLMSFVISSAYAQSSGMADLRWAKSLMDRGDYAYAAEKFNDIARSQNNSVKVRKEAMYYMGYCNVKNNDPWQAVRVFERFLEIYDDGYDMEFIPDALYVLGRVYEETGDTRNAIKVYRRCRKNYPQNSFARKSAERLVALKDNADTDPFDNGNNNGGYNGGDDYTHGGNNNHGGHNHGGNHGGHNGANGISREIRELLRVAETVSNSYTRDQMLLEGADRARTGDDFVALTKAINNDFTRSQIFDKVRRNVNYKEFTAKSMIELASFIQNSYLRDQFLVNVGSDFAKRDFVSSYDFVDISAGIGNFSLQQQLFAAIETSPAFKVMSARTVVDLANTCKNSYIHDQFLLSAAQKCPFTYRDCVILAEACSNGFTKTQILQAAKDNDNHGSNHHGGHYRTSLVETPVAIPQIDVAVTDPFNGFKFNKAQINRVSDFIKAVETRKGMRDAAGKLKKADLKNATVREYMEKFRTMQNFEDIHRPR